VNYSLKLTKAELSLALHSQTGVGGPPASSTKKQHKKAAPSTQTPAQEISIRRSAFRNQKSEIKYQAPSPQTSAPSTESSTRKQTQESSPKKATQESNTRKQHKKAAPSPQHPAPRLAHHLQLPNYNVLQAEKSKYRVRHCF